MNHNSILKWALYLALAILIPAMTMGNVNAQASITCTTIGSLEIAEPNSFAASAANAPFSVWATNNDPAANCATVVLNTNTVLLASADVSNHFGEDYVVEEGSTASGLTTWTIKSEAPLSNRVFVTFESVAAGLVGTDVPLPTTTLTQRDGFEGVVTGADDSTCDWFEVDNDLASSATVDLGANTVLIAEGSMSYTGTPLVVSGSLVSTNNGSPLGERVLLCGKAVVRGPVLATEEQEDAQFCDASVVGVLTVTGGDSFASRRGEIRSAWADNSQPNACSATVTFNSNTTLIPGNLTDSAGHQGTFYTVAGSGTYTITSVDRTKLGERVYLTFRANADGLSGVDDPVSGTITAQAGYTGYFTGAGDTSSAWFNVSDENASSATFSFGANTEIVYAEDNYGNVLTVDESTNTVSSPTGVAFGGRVFLTGRAIADGIVLGTATDEANFAALPAGVLTINSADIATTQGQYQSFWATNSLPNSGSATIVLNDNSTLIPSADNDAHQGIGYTVTKGASAGGQTTWTLTATRPLGASVFVTVQAVADGTVGVNVPLASATLTPTVASFVGYETTRGSVMCAWFTVSDPDASSAVLPTWSNTTVLDSAHSETQGYYGQNLIVDLSAGTVSTVNGSPLGTQIELCGQALNDGVVLH